MTDALRPGERLGAAVVDAVWVKHYRESEAVKMQIGVRVTVDGRLNPRENAVAMPTDATALQQLKAWNLLRTWAMEQR